MKAVTRNNLLILVGAIFGYLGLFHRAVGLPDWVQIPFFLVLPVCLGTIIWLQRRAKQRGEETGPRLTSEQNRRLSWLMLIVAFLSCAAGPFVLPYAGVNLPFSQLVLAAAASFIIAATLIVAAHKRRTRQEMEISN